MDFLRVCLFRRPWNIRRHEELNLTAQSRKNDELAKDNLLGTIAGENFVQRPVRKSPIYAATTEEYVAYVYLLLPQGIVGNFAYIHLKRHIEFHITY